MNTTIILKRKGDKMDIPSIARMIDISSVKAESTIPEINRMVEVAQHFRFICAFAMPCFTKHLVDLLANDKDIMAGGVVGFPSGVDTTSLKIAAAMVPLYRKRIPAGAVQHFQDPLVQGQYAESL